MQPSDPQAIVADLNEIDMIQAPPYRDMVSDFIAAPEAQITAPEVQVAVAVGRRVVVPPEARAWLDEEDD